MSDATIIALLGAAGSLIAVITPVLKLNTSIVKLNTTLEHVLKEDKTRDNRLNKHSEEIDELRERQCENEKTLGKHDLRIGNLEKEREGE